MAALLQERNQRADLAQEGLPSSESMGKGRHVLQERMERRRQQSSAESERHAEKQTLKPDLRDFGCHGRLFDRTVRMEELCGEPAVHLCGVLIVATLLEDQRFVQAIPDRFCRLCLRWSGSFGALFAHHAYRVRARVHALCTLAGHWIAWPPAFDLPHSGANEHTASKNLVRSHRHAAGL